ncbi:MAG: hypothetical protein JST01_08195 [Cyanobacteria bacterium SZAS TMP-1]|nr:hypothetical protein [Cyanobacteria bacterium SZAS TMP-1]
MKSQTAVLQEARARALHFLLATRTEADQQWFPYSAGGDCSLEATAWSLIALRQNKEVGAAGLDYLASCQNQSDGGWSTRPGAGKSDWNSGPVLLCLRILHSIYGDGDGDGDGSSKAANARRNALKAGMSHLLDSRVEFFGPTARLLLLISKGRQGLEYGRGWPWDPKCFHWLEPTAYCLLALKLPTGPEKDVHKEVVKFADKFITDHACQGGGWNHGNDTSLGAFLPPYRLTTAEALLALQDYPQDARVKQGQKYLQSQAAQDSSSLSLAFSILALNAFGLGHEQELQYLLQRQAANGSFGPTTMSTAMAALALEAAAGTNILKAATAGGTR